MAKVINISGTSQNKCSCGSWLEHWKKFSGKSATMCSEKYCIEKDIVGAHVQKLNDNKWYIIPLCQSHNLTNEEIEVVDSTVFVSARLS